MNRAERRAALRLTEKSAQTVAPVSTISESQLTANRANAQLSTGAQTQQGRAASSMNALKTALTGRTVLLPSEDVAEYESFVLAHADRFQPIGILEKDFVQSIADTSWRLRRLSALEHAVFAKGRADFAAEFKGQDVALLDLHIAEVYEKQLRNFHIQESRLLSRRTKETAELLKIQAERRAKEEAALAAAANLYRAARAEGLHYTPEPDENGFVFSTAEIERYLAAQKEQTGERAQRAAS